MLAVFQIRPVIQKLALVKYVVTFPLGSTFQRLNPCLAIFCLIESTHTQTADTR